MLAWSVGNEGSGGAGNGGAGYGTAHRPYTCPMLRECRPRYRSTTCCRG